MSLNKEKLAEARRKLREQSRKLREAEQLAGGADGYGRHRDDAAARSRAKSTTGREIGPLPKIVDSDRRAKALASLRVYCETYKAEKFYLAWSEDQLTVIRILEQCAREGGLFAIAMMRGGGKIELCKAAIEWAVLVGCTPMRC